ncbi:MAG: S-layer homology domain-containing protein [Oscillospiraceae bacterium]|nr:S-layer homology domain-containing protein [Oscillospiraceae bacterium]
MNKKVVSIIAALSIASASAASVSADPKSAAELLARKSAYEEHMSAPHTKDNAAAILSEIAAILGSDPEITASAFDDEAQKKIAEYFDLAYSALKTDNLTAEDYDNAYHCLAALKALVSANISSKKFSESDGMNVYITEYDNIAADMIIEIPEYNEANGIRQSFLKEAKEKNAAGMFSEFGRLAFYTANYFYKKLPVFDMSTLEFNNNFTDVSESDWFYGAVSFVCSMAIFKGTSETSFEPQTTMTRGMFITALSRTENISETYRSPYADVAEDSWYANAIGWAFSKGYLSWAGEGEFLPDAPITREEMVRTVYLCAKDKSAGSADVKDISSFSDYSDIAPDKVEAFEWAYGAGIVNGNSDGTLNPKGTAKRCEVAQIFLNLFEFLQKK